MGNTTKKINLLIKVSFALLIILLLSAAVLIGYSSYIYIKDNNLSAEINNDTLVEIHIDKGENITSISQKLYNLNIISSEQLFKLYGKHKGLIPDIKFGSHYISTNMTYLEIYNILSESSIDNKNFIKVTIPEGYNIEQIAEVLEENSIGNKEDFLSLCETGDFDYFFLDNTFINSTSSDTYKLEGFLFPETYYIHKDASSFDVIKMMLDKFNDVIVKYDTLIANSKYSLYEIIKIASIVERESKSGNERALVAGVFYNRLHQNMKLESCATVEYILKTKKRVLSNEDISIDSPFNTYKYEGLPPTPISNPGEESLKAAISPVDTEYLFFVSKKGTDKHAFAKTYNEHVKNINTYRD